MNEIDQLLQEFPPGVREHLRGAWGKMPEAVRGPLIKALRELPEDLGRWRELIRLALSHVRVVTGDKRRVAIVGPANVGKSTLYNQLVRNAADRAEVSPVPGTTRVSQTADAGLFAAVDTPGADAVGAVGEAEKERAFATARDADFLVIVFDAIQGIKRTEQELFRELQALEHPHVVVLNKVDLVAGARERDRVVEAAGRAPLTPTVVRARLLATGLPQPQGTTQPIGPRPQVAAAAALALTAVPVP